MYSDIDNWQVAKDQQLTGLFPGLLEFAGFEGSGWMDGCAV
jgi:hypothetical protein